MRRRFHRHPDMPLQRHLGDPARGDGNTADGVPGDCFRTAMAGALGRPRDSVPHFLTYAGTQWWWELQRWTLEHYAANLDVCPPDMWHKLRSRDRVTSYVPGRPYIVVSGPSPRGSFHHAVVADLDLNIVHDPHPLGEGLAQVDAVMVFRPADWTPPPRRALTVAPGP